MPVLELTFQNVAGSPWEGEAMVRLSGQSLQAARKHIHATKHRRTRIAADAPTVELQDWFAPQLYQAGEDVELLPKKVSRRKKPAAPMFVGFPPPPRAVFWRKDVAGLPTRRHCVILARNVLSGEVKYFLSNRVPGERNPVTGQWVTLRWLLRVAFGRWSIESCFREG